MRRRGELKGASEAPADPNLPFCPLHRSSQLSTCSELHDALWEVIQGLTVAEKRKLLLFITGVDKLPAKGTEFLTIETPFLPMTLEDQRKMLLMVPQSHTCDNILELPNYWKAINKVHKADGIGGGGRGGAQEIMKLKKILREKLLIAIDNAKGYGLDAIQEEGNGGGRGVESLDGLLGREGEEAGGGAGRVVGEESEGESSFNIPTLEGVMGTSTKRSIERWVK